VGANQQHEYGIEDDPNEIEGDANEIEDGSARGVGGSAAGVLRLNQVAQRPPAERGSDPKGMAYDPPYTEIGKDRVMDTPALSVTVTAIVHGPPTFRSKPGTT
jgi:hypothetical protein